jgi:hypothetical protein
MATAEMVRSRRNEVLRELAGLEHMRRGSVVEQFVEDVHKDGREVRRGPYLLYSYKQKKKTISRRLKGADQAERYRDQINAFRRFQDLMAELVNLGEQLCEIEDLPATDVKKTTRSRWRRRQK